MRCGLPVPMGWFHAGGDPLTNRMHQCADGPLLRAERATKWLLHSPDLTRWRQAGEVVLALRPQFQIGANFIIPIALAASPLPNFLRLRALALLGRRSHQRVEGH